MKCSAQPTNVVWTSDAGVMVAETAQMVMMSRAAPHQPQDLHNLQHLMVQAVLKS